MTGVSNWESSSSDNNSSEEEAVMPGMSPRLQSLLLLAGTFMRFDHLTQNLEHKQKSEGKF